MVQVDNNNDDMVGPSQTGLETGHISQLPVQAHQHHSPNINQAQKQSCSDRAEVLCLHVLPCD